jgi:cytochrome c-type biogenesis protein CcmH/NrfG
MHHSTIATLLCCAALAAAGCKRSSKEPAQPAAAAPAPAPEPAPPIPEAAQERIALLEAAVARNPQDAKSWAELGNVYFDTQQREKAVQAYGEALELEPRSPDVLTDQGVMFRELRQLDKARANFERARELDPKHVRSLYNLGVLYAADLGDADKAIAAWEEVVRIAPQSPDAVSARQALHAVRVRKSR